MPKNHTTSKKRGITHKPLRKTMKHQQENTKTPLVIGLIYAKWCGHCQALEPEWKSMKQNILKKKSVSPHQIVEIEESDPDKDAKIEDINKTFHGGKLQANGYPTIFKNVGGKIEYYEGGRTAVEMENWVLGKTAEKRPVHQKTWRNYFFGGFQSGTLTPKPTPRPKPSKPSRSSKPSKPSRDSK